MKRRSEVSNLRDHRQIASLSVLRDTAKLQPVLCSRLHPRCAIPWPLRTLRIVVYRACVRETDFAACSCCACFECGLLSFGTGDIVC